MNCASRILPHLRDRPDRPALWTARYGPLRFDEFGRLAGQAQALAAEARLDTGDAALLLAAPGPALFAAAVGLLGRGITVVLVEPWLPLAEIDEVLAQVRPRAFIGSRLAQLWALRLPAARRIPHWIHTGRIARPRAGVRFECADLYPATPAILTFTSGTTGRPKGIVRSHGYMWDVHEIVVRHTDGAAAAGPELCVFPNLALLHLGTGRGAVLVPDSWGDRALARIAALPPALQPESVTCGPAFLRTLLRFAERRGGFHGLRYAYVGGAQTDCWILERAFERWPDADFHHVYGGTEAEPVAVVDAREAVRRSRARDRFQTLFLGEPIPEIRTRIEPDGLWVAGPNVAPAYAGASAEDAGLRRTDADGTVWHRMGDRVLRADGGLWFAGRAAQPLEEFELEQRLYARLGTSACFVHRHRDGRLVLYGEGAARRAAAEGEAFRAAFPELHGVRDLRIVRDRRHRARIDRAASLRRAGVDAA
jgi:olefin beta-lactone synthetase